MEKNIYSQMKIFKKLLFLILILIILFIIIFYYNINKPAGEDRNISFIISKGENVSKISDNLKSSGLINSKFYFILFLRLNKQYSNIKAGEYLLNKKNTIKEIVEILSNGKIINNEITLRIIEGWTINDINKYLKNIKFTKDDIFLNTAKNGSTFINKKYNISGGNSLEGFLYPDTYRVYKNATAIDLIKKMTENFKNKFTDDMFEEATKRKLSVEDIIIMASIIEKEVKVNSSGENKDAKIVSGIFWNRINIGQGLESDATLSYILNDNKSSHSGEDLKLDSPYNTYKYRGLPPTPICNPGIEAIIASIYPQDTDYNYFLTDPKSNKTIFSKTYKEHLDNKAKYLK